MPEAWAGSRVVVTGGSNASGRFVVEELRAHGAAEVFVPRSREYDLRDRDAIRPHARRRAAGRGHSSRPSLAASGPTRENPGRSLYDNAIMGIELIEHARQAGVRKFVTVGTVCSYPKFAPGAIPEAHSSRGTPYERSASAPQLCQIRRPSRTLQAYRQQYGFTLFHLLPV